MRKKFKCIECHVKCFIEVEEGAKEPFVCPYLDLENVTKVKWIELDTD